MKRLVFAVCLAGASLTLGAAEAGMVKTAQGSVTVERGGKQLAATPGLRVETSDRVVTGAGSSVGITLRDNTLLAAGPNSVLTLDKFAFDATTHAGALDATLKRGSLSVISGKIAKSDPDAVRFHTPTVTLGVRGTEFVIEAAGED